jgi:hypothetical protein
MNRSHVVILGAGASLQALPDGDRNGRRLPLMRDIVDFIGLKSLFEQSGLETDLSDFEKAYSELVETGCHPSLIAELEHRVTAYFAEMELPDAPTLYDHLVLSLREKDVIATFNWDPFLWQAINRCNEHFEGFFSLPRTIFLHGNTAIGYVQHEGQILIGSLGAVSRRCGKPFEVGPLLFPVAKKDYQKHESIRGAWEDLKSELANAYIVTVFGYGAPSTDVEAIALLKDGWWQKGDRRFEEIEIVDIRPDQDLYKVWKPFIHSRHYRTTSSFYDSTIGRSPRRSCDAIWQELMNMVPIEPQALPQTGSWEELGDWLFEVRAEERSRENS